MALNQNHNLNAATLQVRGFLNLEKLTIKQSRLTVLIGPQASGKSLISKLFFYFQDFLSNEFIRSFEESKTKRAMTSDALEKFRKFFDPTSWSKQSFSILYRIGKIEVTIKNTPGKSGRGKLTFDYCDDLDKFHRSVRTGLKRVIENLEEPKTIQRVPLQIEISRYVSKRVIESGYRYIFTPVLFIPAGRSFFSSLKDYVFSFIARDIGIDPFLSEFGSSYELARRHVNRDFMYSPRHRRTSGKDALFKKTMNEIISGSFTREKEDDWIDNGNYKVKVSNASSGQQEAIPLLLVLSLGSEPISTS